MSMCVCRGVPRRVEGWGSGKGGKGLGRGGREGTEGGRRDRVGEIEVGTIWSRGAQKKGEIVIGWRCEESEDNDEEEEESSAG